MAFPNVSNNLVSKFEAGQFEISSGAKSWRGRDAVVADQAYLARQDVEAGVGPGAFDGFGRALVAIGILFAGAIAALAVGFATASLESALMTLGAIGACAGIVYLAIDPKC